MASARLLGQLLSRHRAKRRYADYSDIPGFSDLDGIGVIKNAGDVDAMPCDGCDVMPICDVAPDEDRIGWWCPSCGFCVADPDDLRAFRVDLDVLHRLIAGALSILHTGKSLASSHDRIWSIGSFRYLDLPVDVFLLPGIPGLADMRYIKSSLEHLGTARNRVVLVPDASPLIGILDAGSTPISIEDVVSIKGGVLSLNRDALAQRAGIHAPRSAGKPPQFEPMLSSMIRDRAESGAAKQGQNAEIKAVRLAWGAAFPSKATPSDATIRRTVVAYRTTS